MLRALFVLLLLLNALLLAWNLNLLAPLGWPSTRAADSSQPQQVRPETLQILPASAVPASTPTSTPAAASASQP